MKGKKSMILIFSLAAMSLLIFSALFIKLNGKKDIFEAQIGETQYEILIAIAQSEQDLLYIDQSVKYSLLSSLHELERKGGFSEDTGCGQYAGYVLWQNEEKRCNPAKDDLITSLQNIIPLFLDAYLGQHGLEQGNYEFYFLSEKKKTRLVATALSDLRIPIQINTKQIGEYAIKPSADILVNYDMNFYQDVSELLWGKFALLDKITQCEAQDELSSCVDQLIKESNEENSIQITIDCENKDTEEDRTYVFCASEKGKSYYIPDQREGMKKVTPNIKFALYIADQPPRPIRPEVQLKKGEDKSLLLSFDLPQESDIDRYNIYYSSEFNLQDQPIVNEQITETQTKIQAQKMVINAEDIRSTQEDLASCTFTTLPGNCEPSLQDQTLYKGQDGKMFLVLRGLEEKQYSIVITAVDKKDQEIPAVEYTVSITPQDLLAPSPIISLSYNLNNLQPALSEPLTHIDGSIIQDQVTVYYFLPRQPCATISLIDQEHTITQSRRTLSDIQSIIQAGAPGDVFCLVALALDQEKNPIEEVINQGITSLKIKPEYQSISSSLFTRHEIIIPHPQDTP